MLNRNQLGIGGIIFLIGAVIYIINKDSPNHISSDVKSFREWNRLTMKS